MGRARDPGVSWGDLRLGITVSLGLLMAVLVVLLLGTTRGPFMPDTYPLHINLADAGGVRVGSFVQVGGMPAGEVSALEIVPRETPRSPVVGDSLLPAAAPQATVDIRLELAIQESFASHITPSSRAQLASLGLGGERYVRISAGDVRESPLPPGATIETIASVDWDLIIAKLARALNEGQVIAGLMEEIKAKMAAGGGSAAPLLDVESALYSSLDRLAYESEAMLTLLDEGEGLIPRYRSDPTLRRQIDDLRANLAAIDSLIDDPQGDLAGWSRPVELRQALADLAASTRDLNRRIETSQGSLGRFLNDEELFIQIRVLQAKVAELVEALSADPFGAVNIKLF